MKWLEFMSFAFMMAVTPGPNTIMSMSGANQVGLKRNFPFNLGVLVGFSVVGSICALLLSALNTLIPQIELPMKVAGAVYMLYMAYRLITSAHRIEDKHTHAGFVTGVMMQFINPKLYLLCIVSMETYVLPVFGGQTAMVIGFVLGMAVLSFFCTLLWALLGSACRKLFSQYAKWVNAVMAAFLIYCAISIFH